MYLIFIQVILLYFLNLIFAKSRLAKFIFLLFYVRFHKWIRSKSSKSQQIFLRLRSNGKMGFMQYGCIYPSFFSYTLGNIFLISYETSRICKEQTGKVFFASLRKIPQIIIEVKVPSLGGFSCVREASLKRKNVIKKSPTLVGLF